jgi:gliding motility-associated-like protein
MKKLRILFILAGIIMSCSEQLCAQDFSNKGKDFWVGYGSHISMYNPDGSIDNTGGTQNMVLYFTSDEDANVTVEIPATGWSRRYQVKAGSVTSTEAIPKTGTDDARLTTEGIVSRGIHITSDKNIVAYTHIYDKSNSGASLLFPTTTLGQDYYILGFKQYSDSRYAYPYCFVIATEDNTTVEITPSVNTQQFEAGKSYTVELKKGQVYNLLARLSGELAAPFTAADLSGTRIRTLSTGSGGCKRIAVFCGSGKLSIVCDGTKSPTGDNTIQQVLPRNAWGTKYITVPTKNMDNNFFRVMVSDQGTVVKLNGAVLNNIIAGRYYEFQSNAPAVIEGSKEVMVAQFISSANQCNNNLPNQGGDPEMIFLSPVEQNINRVVLNSTAKYQIQSHFINVMLPTADVASFTIDNQHVSSQFKTVPASPDFSYAQLSVSSGVHYLQSQQGFNAIAYGYGHAESYGYNAGTNVKDNYQYISVEHPCVNAAANIAVVLPYKPLSITWLMKDNPIISPNTDATVYNPEPDSVFAKNGRTLYLFRLAGDYRFTGAGAGTLTAQVNNPMADGCSGIQEISVDISSFEQPSALFSVSDTLCANHAVRFTDISSNTSDIISKRYWDYGNNAKDTLLAAQSSEQYYSAAGSYTASLVVETAQGCKSEPYSKTFTIFPSPQAAFILPVICKDATADFKDSSYMTDGSAAKFQYNWDFGDEYATHGNLNTSVDQNPHHKYSYAGNYHVKLQVATDNKCTSAATKLFTVNGNMLKADFDIVTSGTVCSGGKLVIKNTSTIDFGRFSRIVILWDADGRPDDVTDDGQPENGKLYEHVYPAFHQPATKTFQVKLLAYAGATCVSVQSRSVTVSASPSVQFSSIPGICANAAAISITQAKETSGFPGSFSFSGPGVSSEGVFNPQTTGAGSFPVQALFTTDKGCRDSATQTITVWALPVADWTYSSALCEKHEVLLTDQSATPAGHTITKWNWVAAGSATPPAQAATVAVRYDTIGNYPVSLQVVTDKGCVSGVTEKILPLHAQPKVGFSLPVVCLPNGSGTFKDQSTIADGSKTVLSYHWDFGDSNDPTPSSQKNPTHRFSAPGPYNIKLTVTSKDGCSASLSQQLSSVYQQPGAAFELSKAAICQGSTIDFTDHSTAVAASVNSWQWNMGKAGTSSQQNPSQRFRDSGTYAITLTVQDTHGCTDTATQTVKVYPIPQLRSEEVPVAEGATVQLKPAYIATDAHFHWSPGTYLSSDTAAAPFVHPLDDIAYRIDLTAAGGCTTSGNLNVKLVRKPIIPNAFSPNGDGINDVWHITYLSAYPNCTVDVYNRYGQRVFTSTGYRTDWNGSYNSQPLTVGTYYYVIDLKNGAKPLAGYVVILK